MTKANRLQFIRSRALALRVSSVTASPSLPSLSPASLAPFQAVKSAHVWRAKGEADADKGEALPSGFIPSPFRPFVPAIDPIIAREIEPLAYAEALPEIGAHNLAHAVNCMLIALPWGNLARG